MPINSYKLGPGTLKLGPIATALDVSCQLSACTVTTEEAVEETSEAIDALCGETLAAEETGRYTYALTGTMIQDLAAAGVVAWSWTNEGAVMEFEFVPNTVQGTSIAGTVRVVPLNIGGDVKSRPTSEFTWACPVKPTPTFV